MTRLAVFSAGGALVGAAIGVAACSDSKLMHSALGDPRRVIELVEVMFSPGALLGRAFEGGAAGIALGAVANGAIYAIVTTALVNSWRLDRRMTWFVIGGIALWWVLSAVGWISGGEM